MYCKLYCLILLQSVSTILTENAVAFISPSTFTASLNSEMVSFTCTAMLAANTSTILAVNMFANGQQDSTALRRRGISSFRHNDTASILTIEPTAENNNTEIACLVTLRPIAAIESAAVTFLVQGLLSPPPDLQFMTTSRPQYFKLSWQSPFTLDITDLEQDITGYRVCFTYSRIEVCATTENTSLDFLNIRLPLEFNVTAINVIGESNSSHLSYPACETDTGIIMGSQAWWRGVL